MTNANRVVFHIAAPPRPEPRDQRVPPILRSPHPASLPGYSKGAWGLSVLLRVDGIFTATSISPSLRLRQRPSRYAVHARRNLPDKELRSISLIQFPGKLDFTLPQSSPRNLIADPSIHEFASGHQASSDRRATSIAPRHGRPKS